MRWSRYQWYMASDAGYNIAKNMIINKPLYMAYTPNKRLLKGSPFTTSVEAIKACERNYANAAAIPGRDHQ